MPVNGTWLVRSPVLALLGALGGWTGVWVVWNGMYAIGSSVISDEAYAAKYDDVLYWGAIAGGISGFALGLLGDCAAAAGFVLVQLARTLAGAMLGVGYGGRAGITAFLAVHGTATFFCFIGAAVSRKNAVGDSTPANNKGREDAAYPPARER